MGRERFNTRQAIVALQTQFTLDVHGALFAVKRQIACSGLGLVISRVNFMKYLEVRSTPKISRIDFEQGDLNLHSIEENETHFRENLLRGDVSANPKKAHVIDARLASTDLITNAARPGRQLPNCMFAMDSTYAALLQSYKLTSVSFHRLHMLNTGLEYFLFQAPPLQHRAINFRRSRFFTGSIISGANDQDVGTEDEYRKMLKQPGGATLKPEYVELLPEIASRCFDVLPLRFGRIFFSESLVDAVHRERLTGIRFIQAWDDENPGRIYFAQ